MSQLLVQWTTSYFLSSKDCYPFQQQFVFNIQINWSVKLLQKIETIIRSSHDSKWHACMLKTDAERSSQAGHEKPWTSTQNYSDEMYKEDPTQGILDWLQPFTANLEDLEKHVLAHSCERENSDSEGDASKVETHKWNQSIQTNFSKDRKRSILRTEEIGDLITVERKSESRNNHQFAAVVQDLYIRWIQSHPCETKTSLETKNSRKFVELLKKPKVIPHWTSSPQVQKQGIAERAVRRVAEGPSAVLLRFGLDEKWWSYSMSCYCYLRNV